MKKSEHFVRYWVEQWKREKNVNDQPNEQAERASTSREDKQIVNFVEENPDLTLSQRVEQLSRRGIHLSRSTFRRRLIEKDVRCHPVIKKPSLIIVCRFQFKNIN